ncbi:unnamed protein product, partial [Linum tenue]
LLTNAERQRRHLSESDPVLYVVVCWLLWKNRNSHVFENKLGEVQAIHRNAMRLSRQMEESFEKVQAPLGKEQNKMYKWVG